MPNLGDAEVRKAAKMAEGQVAVALRQTRGAIYEVSLSFLNNLVCNQRSKPRAWPWHRER
jgi:hypothetical protein